MSEFDKMVLTFGVACIVVAIISLIFFDVESWMPLVTASFLVLGIASIITWLVSRKKTMRVRRWFTIQKRFLKNDSVNGAVNSWCDGKPC